MSKPSMTDFIEHLCTLFAVSGGEVEGLDAFDAGTSSQLTRLCGGEVMVFSGALGLIGGERSFNEEGVCAFNEWDDM